MQILMLLVFLILCLFIMGRLVYGKKGSFSFIKVLFNFVGMTVASAFISLCLLIICSFILGFIIAGIPGVDKVLGSSFLDKQPSYSSSGESLLNQDKNDESKINELNEDNSEKNVAEKNSVELNSDNSKSNNTSTGEVKESGFKFSTVKLLIFLLVFILLVAIILVCIRRFLMKRIPKLRLNEEEYEISEYFIQWLTIYVVVYQMLFDTLKSLDKILPQMNNWKNAFEVILSPENINSVMQPLLIATWVAIVIEKLHYRNKMKLESGD